MKNQELFDRTVGILVKAYQQGTLMHNTCHACAVGNLVAAGMGYEYEMSMSRPCYANYIQPNWQGLVIGMHYSCNDVDGKEECLSTGYNILQLEKIEHAFEYCEYPQRLSSSTGLYECIADNDDEWMFNGLMSVIDCLMKIHEATPEQAMSAKELFVKA